MRYIIVAILSIALLSCNKEKQASKEPEAQLNVDTIKSRFLPTFGNDTLIAEGGPWNSPIPDTLYSIRSNDTTYIVFEGIRYYIWTRANWNNEFPEERFTYLGVDTTGGHGNILIPGDTIIRYLNCFVGPIPFDTTSISLWVYRAVGHQIVHKSGSPAVPEYIHHEFLALPPRYDVYAPPFENWGKGVLCRSIKSYRK